MRIIRIPLPYGAYDANEIMEYYEILAIVFLIVSAAAVGITIYDKNAAKAHSRNRIPENTLMLIGVMGGALAMFATMLIIRHKTRHKKFMIGLPLIIVAHAAAVFSVYYFLYL